MTPGDAVAFIGAAFCFGCALSALALVAKGPRA